MPASRSHPCWFRSRLGRLWFTVGSSLGLALGVFTAPARAQTGETGPPAPATPPPVIQVAADGSSPCKTIQEAVDRAPAGAVVRIAPGTYEETVRVSKPITLEGAGHAQCTIRATYDPGRMEDPEVIAGFRKRFEEARTVEERKAVQEAFHVECGPRPALLLDQVDGVTVKGLSLTLRGGSPDPGVAMFGWVVGIRGGRAVIEDCVVAGSPASGIGIAYGADAEIRRCLVAGIWNTGIEVVRQQGDATKARILDCTIRNCHHRGVVLAGVDRETRVEGCAISGSAWHGIRYDHASPTVTANRIFDNARCGIYASGRTEALIRGNLFLENVMTGIGCWFHNRDTIEGNTFVRNGRAGLEVLGASSPVIRRNVFAANPTAIGTGDIGDEDEEEPGYAYEGPVAVEQNVFWQNEQNGFWGPRSERPASKADEPPAPDPKQEAVRLARAGGNLLADPEFVDAAAGNYTLAPDSPARVFKAGADPVPGLDPAWPVRPEEEAILAMHRAEQEEQDTEERDWAAYRKAKPWIEDVMQLKDAARRDRALPAIQTALSSKNATDIQAALLALTSTAEANIDRSRYCERLRTLAATGDPSLRFPAVSALHTAGHEKEAQDLLETVIRTKPESLNDEAWRLIVEMNQGALTGQIAERALEELKTGDHRHLHARLASLQGVRRVSPALEARLIQLATGENYEVRGYTIYFVLGRLDPKSPAVVKALIQVAEAQQWQQQEESLRALTHGLAPESRPLVSAFLVRYLADRERHGDLREVALAGLARYAGPADIPGLEAIAANERASSELRDAVTRLVTRLRAEEAKKDAADPGGEKTRE